MTVILGVNSGFVEIPPTGKPKGSGTSTVDGHAWAARAGTTPSTGNYRVTEIGWYCANASQETNFEVGIYDGIDDVGALNFVSRTNAKGTDVGWKRVKNLNWELDQNKPYWVAMQCDATATNTTMDREVTGGEGDVDTTQATLPDLWGGGAHNNYVYAIYAKIEKIIDSSTSTQKEVRTNWPNTSGLTARTTKQTGRTMNLIPEKGSLTRRREKAGFT